MSDLRAPQTTVGFDIYRNVHKAIRVMLAEVLTDAGRLDPEDRTARIAHAGRVREVVRFLVFHAGHEEGGLDEAIRQVLPDQADAIAADHVSLEEDMAELVELADLAFEDGRTDARAAVHHLYLALARFTARYLAHQDVEESVVMPALFDALGFDAVRAIDMEIVTSIAPDDMGWALS